MCRGSVRTSSNRPNQLAPANGVEAASLPVVTDTDSAISPSRPHHCRACPGRPARAHSFAECTAFQLVEGIPVPAGRSLSADLPVAVPCMARSSRLRRGLGIGGGGCLGGHVDIRIVEGNPSLFRAGFVEAAQSPALRVRMQAARDLFTRLVSEQARAFYGFPDTADELVRFGSHLLVAGSVDTVTAWVDGRIDLTSDRLIELFVDHYLASAEAWVKAAKAIEPGWTPAAH